jgi:hypothetical protein
LSTLNRSHVLAPKREFEVAKREAVRKVKGDQRTMDRIDGVISEIAISIIKVLGRGHPFLVQAD